MALVPGSARPRTALPVPAWSRITPRRPASSCWEQMDWSAGKGGGERGAGARRGGGAAALRPGCGRDACRGARGPAARPQPGPGLGLEPVFGSGHPTSIPLESVPNMAGPMPGPVPPLFGSSVANAAGQRRAHNGCAACARAALSQRVRVRGTMLEKNMFGSRRISYIS